MLCFKKLFKISRATALRSRETRNPPLLTCKLRILRVAHPQPTAVRNDIEQVLTTDDEGESKRIDD